MGNHVSQCVGGGGGGAPLVIGPDGVRRRAEELAGVAELMIEAPGHVVARAADVRRERRVRAMAADEPLRAGEVYLLVPAGRAGVRLCDREVVVIGRLASGKKGRRGGSHRRIFPEAAGDGEGNVKGEVGEWAAAGRRAKAHGPGARPWRPVLDTIYES